MLREGERQDQSAEGVGKVTSGLGCSPRPGLLSPLAYHPPTQLGLFVDSTPLGGAGVREGVEVEGGAPRASKRKAPLNGRGSAGILRVCVCFP